MESRLPQGRNAVVRIRDIRHAHLVNQFLDKPYHSGVMSFVLLPKQKTLETRCETSSEGIRLDQPVALQAPCGADELIEGLVVTPMGRLESDSIHPIPPISRPPILHNVDPTAFQMVFKQVPEADARENTDVGTIVDDNIESARGVFPRKLVKKCSVLLRAGVGPDPSIRTINTNGVDIKPHNQSPREIFPPQVQRAAVFDAEFEQADVVAPQRPEISLVVLQIPGLYELVCFVLPGDLAKG